MLAIVKLMFNISDCKIIIVGNTGNWGGPRLQKLGEECEKHEKIAFLTRIIDEAEDVRVVGYGNKALDAKSIDKVKTKKVEKEPVEEKNEESESSDGTLNLGF